MEQILWLIFAVLVIIAGAIGYYGNVMCNLLSVACQILHTISFHANTTNQKLASFNSDSSKQLSQSITEALSNLGEKLDLGSTASASRESTTRRRRSTREFAREEIMQRESAESIQEITQLLKEHLEQRDDLDAAMLSHFSEMLQDVKDIRTAVYSIRRVREYLEAISRELCDDNILASVKKEYEEDVETLEKIIDKIETDERAHTLNELEYRELLRDHMPSDQIDNLEVIDNRVREYKASKP